MAFLLNDASISSRFRSFSSSQNSSDALLQSRHGFHVEPGTRKKADVAMKSMSKLR